jgi:hypothetical protein
MIYVNKANPWSTYVDKKITVSPVNKVVYGNILAAQVAGSVFRNLYLITD